MDGGYRSGDGAVNMDGEYRSGASEGEYTLEFWNEDGEGEDGEGEDGEGEDGEGELSVDGLGPYGREPFEIFVWLSNGSADDEELDDDEFVSFIEL
jgi:hypothetical protein